eukprot:7380837-Prymnesium_polylepis.1
MVGSVRRGQSTLGRIARCVGGRGRGVAAVPRSCASQLGVECCRRAWSETAPCLVSSVAVERVRALVTHRARIGSAQPKPPVRARLLVCHPACTSERGIARAHRLSRSDPRARTDPLSLNRGASPSSWPPHCLTS